MQSYFVVARCLALVLWTILENNIVNLGVLCDLVYYCLVIFVWLNYLLPYYHIVCGCLSYLGSKGEGKL